MTKRCSDFGVFPPPFENRCLYLSAGNCPQISSAVGALISLLWEWDEVTQGRLLRSSIKINEDCSGKQSLGVETVLKSCASIKNWRYFLLCIRSGNLLLFTLPCTVCALLTVCVLSILANHQYILKDGLSPADVILPFCNFCGITLGFLTISSTSLNFSFVISLYIFVL